MKSEITLDMIRDMQHCIGFAKSRVTGKDHRVMHAYRNHYCDYVDNKNWKTLIDLGLAKSTTNTIGNGIVYFSLTPEGFKCLADLCGFKEIIEID